MAIPGTPGTVYTADGLEHTERGIPSSGAADHRKQLAKRERKLAQHDYGSRWADVEGDGELAVITFGSTTGAVREAIARAAARGVKLRLLALRLLAPPGPAARWNARWPACGGAGRRAEPWRPVAALPAQPRRPARPALGPAPARPAAVAPRL